MSIENNQRDLASVSPQQFLDYWWSKRNIDLHTQIPAKVVEVDYIKNSVKVQPLIKTFINNSQALAMEQIDVPMSLLSTGVGGASITLPVKAGCVGLLKFSERDTTNWINGVGNEVVEPLIKDNLSMGVKVYPVSFEVGLFTPASAIEWDSENIVIVNGASVTLHKPDGTVIIKNDDCSGSFNADGSIELSNENGKGVLGEDGSWNFNDALIPSTGNVVTAASTDLDQLKADFDTLKLAFDTLKLAYDAHIHVAPSGGGNTSAPTIP